MPKSGRRHKGRRARPAIERRAAGFDIWEVAEGIREMFLEKAQRNDRAIVMDFLSSNPGIEHFRLNKKAAAKSAALMTLILFIFCSTELSIGKFMAGPGDRGISDRAVSKRIRCALKHISRDSGIKLTEVVRCFKRYKRGGAVEKKSII